MSQPRRITLSSHTVTGLPSPIVQRLSQLAATGITMLMLMWLPGLSVQELHAAGSGAPASDSLSPEAVPDTFIGLLTGESNDVAADVAALKAVWQPGMVPMALETYRLSRNATVSTALIGLLEMQTGQTLGNDLDAWYRWLWSTPEQRHPHYASFKSSLYQHIDPLFATYFDDARKSTVRLDEIRWGGVVQDGIPPLRQPAMIAADDASYLDDDNVVFGVAYDGDARAYPKRILAWHEMFIDTIGGTEYAGVYCTLCGALILYETSFDGQRHALGTSGFLYRSNKVMYDKATQSLWNTTWGEPVVGPLVGRDIRLARSHVVTTTWGEWRRRHPDTSVLSLQTGHARDYGEGVAYNAYFATDELMFGVPEIDTRLPNKAEILALQFAGANGPTMAISADFLEDKPVWQDTLESRDFAVFTDVSGANRVYEAGNAEFVGYDGDRTVTDASGTRWTLSEAALSNADGDTLARLPAHRAFWFGWFAAHEDTELVM